MEQKNKLFEKQPLLFLVFNRMGTTKKVFEEIKKAKPKKIYIAADGPRNKKEKKKTDSVRRYILNGINWDCQVKKLFRNKNLGLKKATITAIDWFFKNEEKGIILEDDDIPSQSFFRFCYELLEKYKNDKKIMSITGSNPLGIFNIDEDYLFSKYSYCWGWASWKRAWKKNDPDLKKYIELKKKKDLKKYYPNFLERIMRQKKAKDVIENKINSWAIPWSFSHQLNNSLAIVPRISLVKNIGFSEESTHTKKNYWDQKFLLHKKGEISFPLNHPKRIILSKKFNKKFIFHESKRIIFKKLFSIFQKVQR